MLRRITAMLLAMMMLAAACPALAEDIYVTSVELDLNATAFLPGGEGKQLTATVLPANASDPRIY